MLDLVRSPHQIKKYLTPIKRTEPTVLGLGPSSQVSEESLGAGRIYYVEIQTIEVKEADISI